MAKKPDGRPASVDRVSFTRPAAERIGKAVRQVEAGNRDLGAIEWGPRGGAASKVFRVCTFTGAWPINSAKTVTFRGVTSTPNTVSATNIVYDLPSQGELPCGIAKDGTAWYLVAVKHTTAEVITGATLGTAGLVFTRARIQVVSTATASQVSIGTTACT
jgi:hypothetical protein